MHDNVIEIGQFLDRESEGEGSLITALENIQSRFHYLPPEALIMASEKLGVPLSQAYAVATFYQAFSLKPRGRHSVCVCMGTACHVRGSAHVLNRLETELGVKSGETTRDRFFSLNTVNCLGACALGPIILADNEYSGHMTPQKADMLIRRIQRNEERKL